MPDTYAINALLALGRRPTPAADTDGTRELERTYDALTQAESYVAMAFRCLDASTIDSDYTDDARALIEDVEAELRMQRKRCAESLSKSPED